MSELVALLGVAGAVFVSTNLDDLVLLAVFFADPRMRPRAVVAGQFLGIGALTAASAAAAMLALAVPPGYVALLGLVPLALGARLLWARRNGAEEDDADEAREAEARLERRARSQALAVAGVTIANGGDNLGVYIPLFAQSPATIPVYAAVFAALTAAWCWLGYRLVRHPMIGERARRIGHAALPYVLLALGIWILAGARDLPG